MFREFMVEVFDKDRVHAQAVNDQSVRTIKIGEMSHEADAAKLQCTQLAVEQMLDLQDMLDFSHAISVIGPTTSGKTHLWKGLATMLEARGVKVTWRQLNPKIFTSTELYGYTNTEDEMWKEGILPVLLKDLKGLVECRHRWLVIDCDIDPSWAEDMHSLLDDRRLLSLANSEQLRIVPEMSIIIETSSLRFAAPSMVSRLSIINTIKTTLDWENWVKVWLTQSRIIQNRLETVMEHLNHYVPLILAQVEREFHYIIPVSTICLVKTLCGLLDALITNENIPKHAHNEAMLIEKYFVFASVWAFGSGLTFENKRSFNVWWRQTFKSVRFPSKFTVFDYSIRRSEFVSWTAILEDELEEASLNKAKAPLQRKPSSSPAFVRSTSSSKKVVAPPGAAFVHTADSTAARSICGLATAMNMNLLMVGGSGSGKTALINDILAKFSKDYTTSQYQSTYLSDSKVVQGLLEAVLEKKAGKNFGPIAAKHLVFFLDDMNLEHSDQFGGQSGLELIRQVLDYKTWYDRSKHTIKVLNNTQLIAAMNLVRGNSNVNARLLRHFFIFHQEYAADSVTSIFTSILKAHFEQQGFSRAVFEDSFVHKLVLSTVELQAKMTGLFRKGTEAFHYDFNLRHQLAILRGMTLSDIQTVKEDLLQRLSGGAQTVKEQDVQTVKEQQHLVSLWAHEAQRVYRDSLVSQSAYVTFDKLLRDVCKRFFKDFEQTIIFAEPFMFTNLLHPEMAAYQRLSDIAEVKGLLEQKLPQAHNEGKSLPKIVFFDVSVRHVVRLARSLYIGHTLIVSEGGNGKQTLMKMAAYVQAYTVYPMEPAGNLSAHEFRQEIRDVFMRVGLRDERILLLATEATAVQDKYLEPISEVLTTGEIVGVFSSEDRDSIYESLRNDAKDLNYDPVDRDTCFRLFIQRVKASIRIALCLTPGKTLRQRCEQFPALLTCTQVYWIHSWDHHILQSAAAEMLGDLEIPPETPDADPETVEAGAETVEMVANILSASFEIVKQMTEDTRMLTDAGQNLHGVVLTPKLFIDHVNLMKDTMQSARERIKLQAQTLTRVLERIQEVNSKVTTIEQELAQKVVEIDEVTSKEEVLLDQIRNATVNMEEDLQLMTEEQGNVDRLKEELQKQEQMCSSVLERGAPVAQDARDAVKDLSNKRRDLIEMKANPNSPHVYIEQVLFAMLALREIPQKSHDWENAKRMLKDVPTVIADTDHILAAIGEGRVEARVIQQARVYMNKEGFEPEKVAKKNAAAGPLCQSVLSIVRYFDQMSSAQPTLQLLGQIKDELAKSNAALSNARTSAKQLENELEAAKKECQVVTRDKNKVLDEAKALQNSLAFAQRLLMAIDHDHAVWSQEIQDMKASQDLLLGDAVLAASFVSYMGPMAPKLRKEFVKEMTHGLKSNMIKCSTEPLRLVSNQLSLLTWAVQGLSQDATMVENATIVSATSRTPLLVDPCRQLTGWLLRKSHSGKVLRDAADSQTLRSALIQAVETGWTVIVDQIENGADSTLLQIAAKHVYRRGEKEFAKFGSKEVECNPRFQLYLVTRAKTPRLPVEIQAVCTLVDCTMSLQDIEESFLHIITQQRHAGIQEMWHENRQEHADLSLRLAQLPHDMLDQLRGHHGEILSDGNLITSLETFADLRSDLTAKLGDREDKVEYTDKICAPYKPLAKTCALVYSIALSLNKINTAYEFSMESFCTALLHASANDIGRPAQGFMDVPRYTQMGSDTNPFQRFRVMASVIKLGVKGVLDRGRIRHVVSVQPTPDDAVRDNDLITPGVKLKLFRFVQTGLMAQDKVLFATAVALQTMLKTGAVTQREIDVLAGFRNASVGNSGQARSPGSRELTTVPAIVSSFISERCWACVCELEEIPGLQKLPHDVEAGHDRWERWVNDPHPETSMLPVYGRTASSFQKLLILCALRPDRLQQGLGLFVSEILGPEYVEYVGGIEHDTIFADMYRITRPRMPLLLFSTAGPEECTRQTLTLIRKMNYGKRVIYCRHGKASGVLEETDFKRSMMLGRWLMLFEAEAQPQWLVTLDRVLLSDSTKIDGEFRAFIFFNGVSANPSIPTELMGSCIKVTYEPPATFKAHIIKSLAVFDNESFLLSVKGGDATLQRSLENMTTALCICHASFVYRNRFHGLGWTRPYEFDSDLLEKAGNSILKFVTSPNVPYKTLISHLSENIYGTLVDDVNDMQLIRQSLYDFLYRRDRKADILPGLRCKEELTYGEYIEYIRNHATTEDANVLGIHRNAPIVIELPAADTCICLLTGMLSPSATTDSGRKSVAAASDSINELLEQLPVNFSVDSIRDDVQRLGALHEPLGYVLLQEVKRINLIFDLVRQTGLVLQAALNGSCDMSRHLEKMLEDVQSNLVPSSWQSVSHDGRHGLGRWFLSLLKRHEALNVWKDCLKEDQAMSLSVWLAGLYSPFSLLYSIKQMFLRANPMGVTSEKLVLYGSVTSWTSPADLEDASEEDQQFGSGGGSGLYVHGLVLEGAAWDVTAQSLVDQALQFPQPAVPIVHVAAVGVSELPAGVSFPIDIEETIDADPPFPYECPVYASANRGDSFLFTTRVLSQDRPTKWLYRVAAMVMEEA
jgi:dynein heavy chain